MLNALSTPLHSPQPAPLTFRFRGESASRLEAFSDGVFAFALTLLVLSLEVPDTFDKLLDLLRGLPAFAVSFALLVNLWCMHRRFFRCYGLDDAVTVSLNGILLFILTTYIYPLKFLFTIAIYGITGIGPQLRDTPISQSISNAQVPTLFLVYGLGLGAVYLTFFLMYAHAWSQRERLELNAVERFETRVDMARYLSLILVPAASILLAYLLPSRLVGCAGGVYTCVAFVETGWGWYSAAGIARLQKSPPR